MKTYSNSEVMMLLEENPKLRFESKICGNYFEMYAQKIQTKEGIFNFVRVDSEGCVEGMDSNILVDTNWTLKKQSVTLNEVLESNKKCRVEHELINKCNFIDGELEGLKEFNGLDCVMCILSCRLDSESLKTIIKEGKWYLEQ